MERLSVLRGQMNAQPLGSTDGEADVFQHVPMAPPDPILSTATAYKNDTFKDKVNLGIGAYRDDNGKPYVFNAIRKAEDLVHAEKNLDKEYLPIDGLDKYTVAIQKLLFGESNPLVKSGQIATVQTLSGTGALRVGFEFCREQIPAKVLVPNPTWVTHHAIIQKAGLQYLEHPYYDPKTRGLNFPAFKAALQAAKPGTIVLLHACAHNPTGVDPTQEQWKELAQVFKARHLFPFFDSAYQGFASGDLERDAFAIRHFAAEGLQMIVAQSLAKNFGMYGERIGALHVVCKNKEVKERVLSQIRLVIRPMYSNPPLHGARVIEKILNNPSLLAEWKAELKQVSERIISMRHLLRDELVALKVPGTWDHIVNQIGMFSYTGLTVKQCEILINKHHIYLLKNGRISMAGINTKNVKYLAKAIKDAVESTASK